MLPPMDMIKGCLAAYDLDVSGTHEEVHARLGAHLVALKLGVKASDDTPTPNSKRPCVRRKTGVVKKSRPTRLEWLNFLREEKEKVKSDLGLSDRVSVMTEVGRRWKIRKAQSGSTSSAPLLLTYHDDSDDGLTQALSELPQDEVNAALEEHGIEIHDNHAINVARLARAFDTE